jgi:uncharacterized membrane protein YcaP (DUF421 family)
MELFRLEISPWELIARGTLIYWLLFFVFRFFLRRQAGSLGLADILMVVLIADASQNGLSAEYRSVSEAAILVITLALWTFVIDWMSLRYDWFARFAEPPAVPLIRHGRVLHANLRREMLSMDELMSQLRQAGVDQVAQVRAAHLEPDGRVSTVKNDQ